MQKKIDHTDHIIPLVNNGTNELSNLQALCVGCHMDKTHNKRENGQFVKFSETKSTFNNQVQEYLAFVDIKHTWKRLFIILT